MLTASKILERERPIWTGNRKPYLRRNLLALETIWTAMQHLPYLLAAFPRPSQLISAFPNSLLASSIDYTSLNILFAACLCIINCHTEHHNRNHT
ncbi:hypothetical protein L228DRAFT_35076 [Xylona heveae TC161]|uniref:Uncharacterized protein n=1 Tax=Xylona heveae (strain CBS 132557 / TC161) TaxID=1328760 RepID=A0A165A7L4_XYLHT|nr:hypothetical protein L228DRAFT_35076 [Xylona heveae TC161]KZF20068.1 hypothetical protein L228DRAFT_35076 [Xylona heveae TC161]